MRASADSTQTFAGVAYVPSLEKAKLARQIERIHAWSLTRDWFTLCEARVDLERILHADAVPGGQHQCEFEELSQTPGFPWTRQAAAHESSAGDRW